MTTLDTASFHGTYRPSDVAFLLTPTQVEYVETLEKESLIQSGKKHYSEMLGFESEPSALHWELLEKAITAYGSRLAFDVCHLALTLRALHEGRPLVLVSLVRAGVPLGVLLKRALALLGREKNVFHYGVSIIRDRGLDERAMREIERKHGCCDTVFVDGWTGKGAIASQLDTALALRPGYEGPSRLLVLADPGGRAWLSASFDDWLIPFGIMGAPISGLTSRTIWHGDSSQYHGVSLCSHLAHADVSTAFADRIEGLMTPELLSKVCASAPLTSSNKEREDIALSSAFVVSSLAKQYKISNVNRIKPSIAEATRAVLRRVPDEVLVRRLDDPDVQLLVALAHQRGAKVSEVGESLAPYRAVTIIKKVS